MMIVLESRRVALVMFALLLSTAATQAQSDPYSFTDQLIRSDGILPAEVSKMTFEHIGSVDFHGDYNASIPIMTVPGRGGLDFPLVLNYRSGIRTTDRASWVGLGWSLETGHIARTVSFLPDFSSGTARNEDVSAWTDVPEQTDSYYLSIPGRGSSVMVSLPRGILSPSPIFKLQEWKEWLINPTVGSFTSKRDYPSGDDYDRYGSLSTQQFANFRSMVRCDNLGNALPNASMRGYTSRDYSDIASFKVTTEDGQQYVFDLALRSDTEFFNLVSEFHSNWRLTKILSPDYIDVNGNGPDDADMGNWIRIEYDYPYGGTSPPGGVRDIRPYLGSVSDNFNNCRHALLTQMTYVKRIVTPTHEAVFNLSPTADLSYLSPHPNVSGLQDGHVLDYTNQSSGSSIQPLKVDEILLYNRCGTSPVLLSKVAFAYASGSNQLAWSSDLGMGKTTLRSVHAEDAQGGHLPSHEFYYTSDVDQFNPSYFRGSLPALDDEPITPRQFDGYQRLRTGRMGYFYAHPNEGLPPALVGTHGAEAWSLRVIRYPTGAVDSIYYELDTFDRAFDSTHTEFFLSTTLNYSPWTNFASDECGIRVSRIVTYDPLSGERQSTRYEYAGGHLPGFPLTYLRGKEYMTGLFFRIKTSFDWANNEVEYSGIEQVLEDGSRKVTQYVTAADSSFGISLYNRQGLWHGEVRRVSIQPGRSDAQTELPAARRPGTFFSVVSLRQTW